MLRSGVAHPAVQRGALGQGAPQGLDDGGEPLGVHHLTVAGPRGPRDVLVHQGAAEVIDSGPQDLADAFGPHLDPADLDVVDGAAVGDPAHGVHQQGLSEGGPPAGPFLKVEGGGHVYERERDEFGETTGLTLELPGDHQVPGPGPGLLDRPEHDGHVGAQPHLVSGSVGEQPLLGVDLVGAEHGPYRIVEDLGRRTRQGLQAGVAQQDQVVGERHLRAPSALGDLECGEPVDVDAAGGLSDRPDDLEVVVAVEARMDAALQADLGGSQGLGLTDPVGDLAQLEEVGGAPEIEGERSLGEGTEPALEGADVGVVDVPVVDVGDLVAHGLDAELVSHRRHGADLGTPGREQGHDLVLAHQVPARHPGQDLAHRAVCRGHGHHRRSGGPPEAVRARVCHQDRGRMLATGGPGVVAPEALGVGGVEDREPHGLVQPPVRVQGELRVQGQAGGQREAGRFGGSPQDVQLRPGPFGVHVVGGHR